MNLPNGEKGLPAKVENEINDISDPEQAINISINGKKYGYFKIPPQAFCAK